jgi:dTDP-glucose 4,6-dehydratase
MTLLVTGAAGFIGLNFVKYYCKKYPLIKVLALDALTYASDGNALASLVENFSQLEFIKGDINDSLLLNKIFTEHRISKVVHFAAESHVDRSISEPDVFLTTNILGTHSLLKCVLNFSERYNSEIHFHHVSTDEVYGSLDFDAPGFTEISPYAPNSPYSASKAASDHLVRAYHVTYGIPITISNCSNNYGPQQYPEKLIPLMIKHILLGKSLPVYGQGINVRDWLYVEDHCAALDLILHKGKMGATYNVGGGTEISNIELVRKLCSMLDNKFKENPFLATIFPKAPPALLQNSEKLINFVTDRKGHDLRYAIDSSKISQELGYQPKYKFDEGLALSIDWYLSYYANHLDFSSDDAQNPILKQQALIEE